MTIDTFRKLWNGHITKWLDASIFVGDEEKKHSDLCNIKQTIAGQDTCERIHSIYESLKKKTKQYYFKPDVTDTKYDENYNSASIECDTKLSRYKRAAVMTYAILLADPLCNLDGTPLELDGLYLKQRLAFYIALETIIQDFDKEKIQAHKKQGPIFLLDILGKDELIEGKDEDSFCMSFYKDLFFAEHYDNFDVLAMANIYGLLTERCSFLLDCKKTVAS